MGFRTGAYATVWETKKGAGNYTDARISISKKDRTTGEYVTDFSGYVRLVGTAHTQASTLQQKDRIKIGDCDVTNKYDKEKDKTYTNCVIFSYEDANESNGTSPQSNAQPLSMPDDDELPFA